MTVKGQPTAFQLDLKFTQWEGTLIRFVKQGQQPLAGKVIGPMGSLLLLLYSSHCIKLSFKYSCLYT